MRIRIRVRFSLPRWRAWKKSTPTLSLVNAEQSNRAMGEGSQVPPLVSVTSSSGSLTSGPRVDIALKVVDKMGLVVEMRADEAVDLANELFMAVRMSERKYELKFGIDWRRAV